MEKGMLVQFGDTFRNIIYHQLCKIQCIWYPKRDFIPN